MKCFYHSVDLDGHCSGAIVKNRYPECEMAGINYGEPFPFDKITKDEEVYMVDFSLQPFEGMEKLNSICKLHWIDHHKSAIEDAVGRGFLASEGQLLAVDRAACELTWMYLHPTDLEPPPAVYLLGRYDVWDHEADHRVLPFQYGIRQFSDTFPANQEMWKNLFCGNQADIETLVENGKLILAYEDAQNAKSCETLAFETELNGLKAICANKGAPTNSQFFKSVYDSAKHEIMLLFYRLKPPVSKWTVSIYSTHKHIDCGAIAKQYGGGGHKQAAGFQCEALPFKI